MASKKDAQELVTTQAAGELVTTQPAGELALTGLMAEFAADAGKGTENVTGNDVAIPYVYLLQTASPQAKEEDDAYIQGAKAGMLFNTLSNEVFDCRVKGGKPVRFVQVYFQKLIVVWRPKSAGGGIVARIPYDKDLLDNPPMRTEKNKPADRDGNELVETAYHFILIVREDGSVESGVLPLSSTKLTPSKRLMKYIKDARIKLPNGKSVEAPSFAQQFNVTTFLDDNSRGEKYMNYTFSPDGFVSDPNVYAAGKAFYESITKGTAKLGDESQEAAAAGAGAGSKEDVPF